MNITDEVVNAAAKAGRDALMRDRLNGTLLAPRQAEIVARAALEAALGDVEPLEDVLGERFTIGDVTPTGDDQWIAVVEEWDDQGNHLRSVEEWGSGVDAAIRNAVANAKGDDA